MQEHSSLTAGTTAEAVPQLSPAAVTERLQALTDRSDTAGLLGFLAALPDQKIPPGALPLLVHAARKLSLPEVLERVLALGTDPALPGSPRIFLLQKLMEHRGEAASLDAWRVLSADPALFQSGSARNAIRWLSMLRLRLPRGSAMRRQADALFAAHRDSHPDPDELQGVELRERLRILLDEADWAEFCHLAANMPERHLIGDAPAGLLTAALQIRDGAAVRRAISRLETELQRPNFRFSVLHRLSAAGMVPEAWKLLNVPALVEGDTATRLRLMRLLLRLEAQAEPALRQELRALYRSMSAPDLPHEAAYPFPAWGPPRAAGSGVPPQRVMAAEGVPPAQLALFERLVAQNLRIVRSTAEGGPGGIRFPQRLLYRDVSVDEEGHIWDAEGRVAPIMHWPVAKGRVAAPADAPYFPEAAVATDVPRNFFHWFAEGLPTLAWRLAPDAPAMPVLHNSAAEKLIRETLALLTDTPPPLVAVTAPVRVGQAHVARRGFGSLYHWERHGAIYERLVQRALERSEPGRSGRLLYLSRRDVARRRMGNEAALEERLAGMGFTIATFQGRPLAEQIRAFQEAELVVTPHGAGLAHLAAARPGLRVFEIVPALAGTERLVASYSLLSAIRGHRHALWLEPVHPVTEQWQVTMPAMLEALRRFMEESPAG